MQLPKLAQVPSASRAEVDTALALMLAQVRLGAVALAQSDDVALPACVGAARTAVDHTVRALERGSQRGDDPAQLLKVASMHPQGRRTGRMGDVHLGKGRLLVDGLLAAGGLTTQLAGTCVSMLCLPAAAGRPQPAASPLGDVAVSRPAPPTLDARPVASAPSRSFSAAPQPSSAPAAAPHVAQAPPVEAAPPARWRSGAKLTHIAPIRSIGVNDGFIVVARGDSFLDIGGHRFDEGLDSFTLPAADGRSLCLHVQSKFVMVGHAYGMRVIGLPEQMPAEAGSLVVNDLNLITLTNKMPITSVGGGTDFIAMMSCDSLEAISLSSLDGGQLTEVGVEVKRGRRKPAFDFCHVAGREVCVVLKKTLFGDAALLVHIDSGTQRAVSGLKKDRIVALTCWSEQSFLVGTQKGYLGIVDNATAAFHAIRRLSLDHPVTAVCKSDSHLAAAYGSSIIVSTIEAGWQNEQVLNASAGITQLTLLPDRSTLVVVCDEGSKTMNFILE